MWTVDVEIRDWHQIRMIKPRLLLRTGVLIVPFQIDRSTGRSTPVGVRSEWSDQMI